MLDIKYIEQNIEEVKKNCQLRKVQCDIDKLIELNGKRKRLLQDIESLNAQKNKLNEEIKNSDNKEDLIGRGKMVKDQLATKEPELKELQAELNDLAMDVPNLTHPDSPIGEDDSENVEIERHGEIPAFNFKPQTHEKIMKELDLIDFERARKVSGSKFYFLKNEGALLEMALINYAFDLLYQKGFTPFVSPDLARDEVLKGIGFNPRGDETQVYSVEKSELSLVGTAEITMGGYHMDEMMKQSELPKRYAALSHCFRTEAGSYGRHSAGLYRVHQFSKVEMFIYCLAEESEKMHEELKNLEVEIFKGLKIPFRVVDICTGDLGGPAYRKYDLEAFMTSKLSEEYVHEKGEIPEEVLEQSWGEITSTSNCTDYQARRLNVKVEMEDGTKEFLHMLNGTAVATSRALIAVVENFQQEDGSILVPDVLQKYMPGGLKKIDKKK